MGHFQPPPKSRHLDRPSRIAAEILQHRKLKADLAGLGTMQAGFQDQFCAMFGIWKAGQVVVNGKWKR